MFHYLGYFDLFKQPLFLRVAGKEKTSTSFGILLSLFIYIVMIYYFTRSDYIQKENPKILSNIETLPHAPLITYNNKTFAFGVKTRFGMLLNDPSYFYILVQAVTVQKIMIDGQMQVQGIFDNRTTHPCRPNDTESSDDYIWISDLFCLDNNSFPMVGGIGEIPSSHLEVHVMMCQNETFNNKCRTVDEINKYFETTSLSMVYVNNVFQTNNYTTPTTERVVRTLYKLEAKFNRLVTITLQKANLITDESILFSNKNTLETFVYETETTELGVTTSVASPIASILFISSNNHLTVTRVYQTLAEAAAVVGGLFSFLVMLGKVLSGVDKSIFITTSLMNFLYSFPQEKPMFVKQNALNTITEMQLLGKSKKECVSPDDFRSGYESPIAINEVSMKSSGNIALSSHVMPRMNLCVESPKNLKSPKNVTSPKNLKSPKNFKSPKNLKSPKSTKSIKKQKSHRSSEHVEINRIDKNMGDQYENYSISEEQLASVPPRKSTQHLSPEIRRGEPKFTEMKIDKSYVAIEARRASKMREPQITVEEYMETSEEQDRLVFNIFDYIRLLAKKLLGIGANFREKLFERAQEKFEGEIDLVNVLQRLQDVERLKEILLTEEQSDLISLLSKPMILESMILEEDLKKKKEEEDKKKKLRRASFSSKKKSISDPNKINRGFHYYYELGNREKKLEPLENRLFTMMDKKFKTFRLHFMKCKKEEEKKGNFANPTII